MKLSFKTILPIILISALLILLAGCVTPDVSPGYTPGTITGIVAAPCCSTSAEPVPDPCCIPPEYWCYYCENDWSLQDNIKVILTYGEEEKATVFTNEDGEYTFTNVEPGKNYVITALCPDYDDERPLVKDVALEVVEGETYDAKITDCISTSLGLVVDYLVSYTVLEPEDIDLEPVVADIPNLWSFPRFKKLVTEVCRALKDCGNLSSDEDVQDALCEAAEEVGRIVIPDLELGCGPGYTPGEGEGECEDPTAEAGGPYTDEVCLGSDSTISFNGTALGTGALTYAWDFGDGDTSNLEDPSHTYLNPFTGSPYTVTLTVTDECGSVEVKTTVEITQCINTAPELVEPPRQAISAVSYLGSCIPTYKYTVVATDPDSDKLKFYLIQNPSGMVIDEDTGVITWTPECSKGVNRCFICGTECVKVKVVDDGCCEPLFAEMEFCIEVWNGLIDGAGGDYVGIGFDGCPIGKYSCP